MKEEGERKAGGEETQNVQNSINCCDSYACNVRPKDLSLSLGYMVTCNGEHSIHMCTYQQIPNDDSMSFPSPPFPSIFYPFLPNKYQQCHNVLSLHMLGHENGFFSTVSLSITIVPCTRLFRWLWKMIQFHIFIALSSFVFQNGYNVIYIVGGYELLIP